MSQPFWSYRCLKIIEFDIYDFSDELFDEYNFSDHTIDSEDEDFEDELDMVESGTVDVEPSVCDSDEQKIIDLFLGDRPPCCSLGPKGTPCWKQFPAEMLTKARKESLDLDKKELDIAVLATLRALRTCHDESAKVRSKIQYRFGAKPICKATFLFIYALGNKRFENLIKHFSSEGLAPRTHGNTKKVPHNWLPFEKIEMIKGFIEKCADTHAMPLPGRLPTFKDYKVMLLPSDMTKSAVYRSYVEACKSDGTMWVTRPCFANIWKTLCPYITVMKPATDLCFVCQQNTNLLMKASNMPEAIKSQRLKDAQDHLDLARLQRDYYNKQCAQARV